MRSQFTVQEGLRLSAQVDALVKGTKIKKAAYQTALDKPKTLGLPAYAKNRPEGFLFPDTYELTGAGDRDLDAEADDRTLQRRRPGDRAGGPGQEAEAVPVRGA